jgi:hypothetical protein
MFQERMNDIPAMVGDTATSGLIVASGGSKSLWEGLLRSRLAYWRGKLLLAPTTAANPRPAAKRGRTPGVKVDGAKLKRYRGKMSQAAFADKCQDVSVDTVRRAETGHRVSKAKIQSMADAITTLIGREISEADLTAETQ